MAGGTFLAGASLYYLSVRLLVRSAGGVRQHLNELGAILHQIAISYREVALDLTQRVDYLPRALALLPLLVIVSGLVATLGWAKRQGPATLAIAVLAVALLPVALRLCYVINDETWVNAGRITSPEGYLLAFALAMLLQSEWPRWIARVAGLTLAALFFALASQEVNAAAMKTIFDEQKINRIVARIESVTPDLYERRRALIVVGELGMNPGQRLKRFSNRLYGSQFGTETFIAYRQAEYLNYYLGREIATRPVAEQRAATLRAAAMRHPWPAPDSVWSDADTINVLLAQYHRGVPVSLTGDE